MTWLSPIVSRYRQSRSYKIARAAGLLAAAAYILLLCFPQPLFAHQITFKNFTVYARQPLDSNIYKVLDRVDARLATSPLNTAEVKPGIFLVNSTGLYAAFSLYLGNNSFGKGFGALPTSNVFINACDAANDLVFRNATDSNRRSLSGVIAHETTHLLIRKRFGYFRNLMMPAWKKEGYAEYVAGGSTLSFETGARMWKASPNDDTGYRYFKYYMLVKHLLEDEKLSVDDLFRRDFDAKTLANTVLKYL